MTTTKSIRHPAGIIHSSEDGYICAQLQRRENRWVLHRVRRFSSESPLKQLSLLKKWVYLGMPCQWQLEDRIDEDTWTSAYNVSTALKPTALTVELEMHVKRLQFNLAGISTDDLFLTTIPLQSAKINSPSFVSVYRGSDAYLVGITVNKHLCGVFRFALDSVPVYSQIGRIQRFWTMKTGMIFPELICSIGETQEDLALVQECVSIPHDQWGADEAELRASGVALAHTVTETVPLIHEKTISAHMLRMRNIAVVSCLSLILLSSISLIVPQVLTSHYHKKATEYQNEYREILQSNKEIRESFDDNKKVAGRILTLQSLFDRQTAWSRLLSVLAKSNPHGLYLEKLGSKKMENSSATQLAFSGWAPSESAVTQFISTLSSESYISDVQLSSIQRDQQRKTITRFKIQCLLHEITR